MRRLPGSADGRSCLACQQSLFEAGWLGMELVLQHAWVSPGCSWHRALGLEWLSGLGSDRGVGNPGTEAQLWNPLEALEQVQGMLPKQQNHKRRLKKNWTASGWGRGRTEHAPQSTGLSARRKLGDHAGAAETNLFLVSPVGLFMFREFCFLHFWGRVLLVAHQCSRTSGPQIALPASPASQSAGLHRAPHQLLQTIQ